MSVCHLGRTWPSLKWSRSAKGICLNVLASQPKTSEESVLITNRIVLAQVSLGGKCPHVHLYSLLPSCHQISPKCTELVFPLPSLISPGLMDLCVSSTWQTHPPFSPTLLMRITLQGLHKAGDPSPEPRILGFAASVSCPLSLPPQVVASCKQRPSVFLI